MALHHSFTGKRILVTGGAQGIGRQLVQRFHDDGATVFTIDKNAEKIEELRKALPKVTAEIVDLTDWDATRTLVESFGVIDHLVNNAGVMLTKRFLDIPKELISTQFNTNIGAVINISQVVAKGLIAAGRGGSIVNVASMAGRTGSAAGGSVYSASKAGLENLTKSMAIELGPHNIRVNAICPGMVDTPLFRNATKGIEHFVEIAKQRCVIKELIDPDQIADLVVFLLSPLSKMIVGESVLIDAGMLTS